MKKIKNIFKEMERFELIGTIIFILALVGVQFYQGSTKLGLITGILGIFYVIFVRMGSRIACILCMVQIILYIILAIQSKFYGDMTINIINFILQFVCWFKWGKREKENGLIETRSLKKIHFVIIIALWAITWIFGTYTLHLLGGNTPYLDSFSTITSLTAMILTVFAYKQTWNFWILHNIVETIMWSFAIFRGTPNAISMVIMMLAYLCNSILAYRRWSNNSK